MKIISEGKNAARSKLLKSSNSLHHLAFDNSCQANIISIVSSGKIIVANKAACKLFGYSNKDLLSKSRKEVFALEESDFKKLLKESKDEEQSIAFVNAIKKSGKAIPCEITSAVFKDEDGIEKSITTITDRSKNILNQKRIDAKKDKLVKDDIKLALTKSDHRIAVNNEWIQHIAKASYDVMWDWNVETGNIYVGDSVAEVFGYQVKNHSVVYNDFVSCLQSDEKKIVEKKLSKALKSGKKVWSDSFAFLRFDGSVAATISRASIIHNDTGKVVRLIGAIKDISSLQNLEKNLEEKNNILEEETRKFQLATKLSFDVIWDYNIEKNEIFLGEGFEEIFGYALKNNNVSYADWENHIHTDDRVAAEKILKEAISSQRNYYENAYQVIRSDASVAKIFSRANIFRHADGTAYRMIGAMQDLSRQKELENQLDDTIKLRKKEISIGEDSFKSLFTSNSEVLYDIDIINKKVIISDGFAKLFDFSTKDLPLTVDIFFNIIHPDDKDALKKDLDKMLLSTAKEWKHVFRFLKSDNNSVNITTSCVVLRNAKGKPYRCIGCIQNKLTHAVLENNLEQEIQLNETAIIDAWQELQETERLALGNKLPIHIHQLLAVSKLFLIMARGGINSKMFLSRSTEYITLAIGEIRKYKNGFFTDNIKKIGFCETIENICHDLMAAKGIVIVCSLKSFLEQSVTDKFKINLFQIIQEQLNNVSKHSKATKVKVKLLQNEKSIQLVIADNGIGFNAIKKIKGFGLNNIQNKAGLCNGTTEFISKPGQGCILKATFPVSGVVLDKRSAMHLKDDKKNILIEKIKEVIVEQVHYSSEQLNTKLSVHLSKALGYDYTYLSNLFSEVEGITIQKFIITQKIERVKELLTFGELTLTQIARKLHYSSTAHLSNQFKKVAGLSPSFFKP